jgi:predicted nucleic acid-binding protein
MVDTSVWVDFFNGNRSSEVTRLKSFIGKEELLIGDLILTELLQGIRYDKDIKRIESALTAYRVVSLVGERGARRSASNYRHLRRSGITVRKTVDCLIATWCIEHKVPLLHADRDFKPFIMLGLEEA